MPRTPWWIDTLVQTQLASGGVAAPNLDNNFSQNDLRGITIVRALIHLSFLTVIEGDVDGIEQIQCGIGVASRDAFGIGVTALPNSEINAERPPRGWIWKEYFTVRETDQAPNELAPGFFIDYRADVRTKRRLDDGRIYLTMRNGLVSGTGFTVQIAGLIRVLCLLP